MSGLKIKVGGYYRDGNGHIIGPIKETPEGYAYKDYFPFRYTITYNEQGHSNYGNTRYSTCLVSECIKMATR